ncbi:DNA mismatch repair endonuclease MutL [Dongshaea marina]|uniref:DNA mismatch repair endonuclease MutL n=1 Tax=Dongshaea marina TaxID=2047966 RepID=UPI000D3EE057|nr:DNA mismatch repair endonuclease MutL [Dongshaea marina]
MSIRILSPRLANQIAAGEVVERPASVVKELVENSLDSGARRIRLEIEQGGAKLIRITDSGSGIPKDELALALSRHATSKIATLDDLEAILSLGFRGEALASISSVSRLTLTSRPSEQEQAWQALAEGRDMEVQLRPAAHPVGTSVEVKDLFFNTPARRKFMRTEKTEFSHIDELLRRIALSRFDTEFTLLHNGRPVRRYRAVTDEALQLQRLKEICGREFAEQALAVESQHLDVKLWGWLAPASALRERNDLQYCYVNGRMIRDKLINHAIRQAHEQWLSGGLHPAYVLYLELPADQLDVNVHPTKHEVRFHQARLVHDFVCQVLRDALMQGQDPELALCEAQPVMACGDDAASAQSPSLSSPARSFNSAPAAMGGSASRHNYQQHSGASPKSWEPYQQLMRPLIPEHPSASPESSEQEALVHSADESHWLPLTMVNPRYLLLGYQDRLLLVAMPRVEQLLLARQIESLLGQGLVAQPLLIPVTLTLEESMLEAVERHQALLGRLGVDLVLKKNGQAMLRKMPAALRHTSVADIFPALLQQLESFPGELSASQTRVLCQWISGHSPLGASGYNLQQAGSLLTELEASYPDWHQDPSLAKPVSMQSFIEEFEGE